MAKKPAADGARFILELYNLRRADEMIGRAPFEKVEPRVAMLRQQRGV